MQEVLVKPEWLKIRPAAGTDFSIIKNALRSRGLVTVCEESHCPNMAECWHNEGTATFMVMGDTCTRGCKFCAVSKSSKGKPLDVNEPKKIAEAISEMELDYAVLTSVDRDDLPDQGAGHFAECIREIKKAHPRTFVEVLTPDFRGEKQLVAIIVKERPDVFAHNIETVKELQGKVRDPRAGYEQSLSVLRTAKEIDPKIKTKSAIIVGFGETEEQVEQAMRDLRKANVDILTIGQYLKPKNRFLQVAEYVHPDTFARYKTYGLSIGFLYVAAGPFVRSSYRAGELFIKTLHEEKSCHEQQ